ncbi:hypothetical protein COBT_000671 [Conglomerata obtusa]
MTITNIEDRPVKRKTIQIKQKRHKHCMENNKTINLEDTPVQLPVKDTLACFSCKKKLRVTTQHECRCGNLFCARHRFSDQHACNFDYRKLATERLKKENPVVEKEKLSKG